MAAIAGSLRGLLTACVSSDQLPGEVLPLPQYFSGYMKVKQSTRWREGISKLSSSLGSNFYRRTDHAPQFPSLAKTRGTETKALKSDLHWAG